MEVYCTRPGCPRPQNYFADLDNSSTLRTVEQKYCTCCGMPLILQGRYLPCRLLGQGGFGAAFLSRDRYTPGMRQCVVKQFKPSGDLSSTQLSTAHTLFEREAAALEQLGDRHDQIPDLLAFFDLTVSTWQPGRQEQFFYLVQEFIDGQTLEEELAIRGKFSETEILEVLQAILPVLQFVHERGSIHRDIKPSNIMRDRNGKLYLLDFGAVKQVTSSAGGASGSTGIYSMGFAPPEQVAGGEIFPSTDLYALAVTAITLLTNKKATELFDINRNQWNWRSHVQVSDRTANVLNKMLSLAPHQRFGSAVEVMAALKSNIPAPSLQHQPSSSKPARLTFSTLEILASAAFTGFEGSLIVIALYSLLSAQPGLAWGIAVLILALLIFAQSRRWIEKVDLLIISSITLVIIFLVPVLHSGFTISVVGLLAVATALIAIALTALFKIIYKLLSQIL
ncbi:MAG TPA: serine/threonine-protein kinase [Leptolyngbyaceae cyanobacterium]